MEEEVPSIHCSRQNLRSARRMSEFSGVDHVLLLKVKDDVTNDEVKKFTAGIYSLTSVKGVLSAVAGEIFVEQWMEDRRRGYTHYFRVRLDSRESLKAYQDDSFHLDVRDRCIKPILVAPPLAVDCDAPLRVASSLARESVVGVDHILLLKLKEQTSSTDLDAMSKGIHSLIDVPGVLSVVTGEIFLEPWLDDRRQGFTHYIRVRLESRDALKNYGDNDLHKRVGGDCIAPIIDFPLIAIDCDSPIQFI